MPDSLPALDRLYPLPARDLSRQWVLSDDSGDGPEGWPAWRLGGLHLSTHPDARACTLESRDGTAIGWIVEALAWLGRDGDAIPEDSLRLPLDAAFTAAEVEQVLYGRGPDGWTDGTGFAGNWTAVVVSADGALRRLYLGPSHSVVFCPERRIAATTHQLIPGLARDVPLSRAVDPVRTGKYYPFGLTPFLGLERLLPNAALDLETFRPVRHWPPESGFTPTIPGEAGAARIVDHARRLVAVLARRYRTFKVPLSAGRDSRAVLACLRPLAAESPERLELFTSARPGLEPRTDVQIARKVAARAGLPLAVQRIRPRPTEADEMLRAFARLGESKWGPILAAPARQAGVPREDVISLPGHAGETARAVHWNPHTRSRTELTPRELVRGLTAPPDDAVLAAAARWLDGLPAAVRARPCDVLDLAHVEQVLGCWDSSTRYLFPGRGRANTSLMATTLALETMLRLPEDYRAQAVLQRDMIAYGWPELLDFPFNEPLGLLRLRWRAGHLEQRLRAGLRRRAQRLTGRLNPV